VTYRLRTRVQYDLEAIWLDTLKRWGADQADAYVTALIDRFGWLALHRHAGKERDEIKPGYRSFPEGAHLVFYILREEWIEIIGVVHQRMDYQDSLG
jgi:toxin ParE1/3/4